MLGPTTNERVCCNPARGPQNKRTSPLWSSSSGARGGPSWTSSVIVHGPARWNKSSPLPLSDFGPPKSPPRGSEPGGEVRHGPAVPGKKHNTAQVDVSSSSTQGSTGTEEIFILSARAFLPPVLTRPSKAPYDAHPLTHTLTGFRSLEQTPHTYTALQKGRLMH